MAFFPLSQFEQHASSRKEAMRSGSDNAHQIKYVVKGTFSNQKENQTPFWAAWQRQQFLFLHMDEAAFRILCMTWGLSVMERMNDQPLLSVKPQELLPSSSQEMRKTSPSVWNLRQFGQILPLFLFFHCLLLESEQCCVIGTFGRQTQR